MFPGMSSLTGGGGLSNSSSATSGADGGNLSTGNSGIGGSTLNMGSSGSQSLYIIAIVGAVGIAALWLLKR